MKEGHSTTDFRLELGAMLAEARKRRGLTQKELAEILDMGQPNLSRIEQGKYMSVDAVGRYLSAIGAKLEVKLLNMQT